MSKRYIKLTERDYKHIREFLIPIIDSYKNTEELTIRINANTIYKIEKCLNAFIFGNLFGVKIDLCSIEDDVIILNYNGSENEYIKNDIINTRYLMNSFYGTFLDNYTRQYPTLPDRYIVNNDACILFYGNNKTIVKRYCRDRKDPVKAFLWAYFLKHTGMTRTKANKYLQKVHDDYINNLKDSLK